MDREVEIKFLNILARLNEKDDMVSEVFGDVDYLGREIADLIEVASEVFGFELNDDIFSTLIDLDEGSVEEVLEDLI